MEQFERLINFVKTLQVGKDFLQPNVISRFACPLRVFEHVNVSIPNAGSIFLSLSANVSHQNLRPPPKSWGGF